MPHPSDGLSTGRESWSRCLWVATGRRPTAPYPSCATRLAANSTLGRSSAGHPTHSALRASRASTTFTPPVCLSLFLFSSPLRVLSILTSSIDTAAGFILNKKLKKRRRRRRRTKASFSFFSLLLKGPSQTIISGKAFVDAEGLSIVCCASHFEWNVEDNSTVEAK